MESPYMRFFITSKIAERGPVLPRDLRFPEATPGGTWLPAIADSSPGPSANLSLARGTPRRAALEFACRSRVRFCGFV